MFVRIVAFSLFPTQLERYKQYHKKLRTVQKGYLGCRNVSSLEIYFFYEMAIWVITFVLLSNLHTTNHQQLLLHVQLVGWVGCTYPLINL